MNGYERMEIVELKKELKLCKEENKKLKRYEKTIIEADRLLEMIRKIGSNGSIYELKLKGE